MSDIKTAMEIHGGLDGRIGNLFRRLSDIRKYTCNDKRIERELDQTEYKLQEIAKVSSKVNELEQTNADLRSNVRRLEQKIKKLQRYGDDLRKEMDEIRHPLELGQITWLFEQDLHRFVLPETADPPGLLDAYEDMQVYLKTNESIKNSEKCRLIKALCLPQEFSTQPDPLPQEYWKTIKKLRQLRNPVAHPRKVNLDGARSQIHKYLPKKEEQCLYIIKVVERVNGLMKLGKLACQFKHEVVSFVYSQNIQQGYKSANVEQMFKRLTRNKKLPLGTNQNKRWEILKGHMQWTKKHDDALAELKTLNRDVPVLQDVKLSVAKEYAADFVSENLTDQCVEIIDKIESLNKLLLGHFTIEFQENVIKYVAPDESQTDIAGMRRWLMENRESEASERWEKLTEEIIWTDEHDKVLTMMINFKREEKISSILNIDTAEILIVDFVPLEFRQKGFDIINVFRKFENIAL